MFFARNLRPLLTIPLALSLFATVSACHAERRPRWDRRDEARLDDRRRCARIADRIDHDRAKIRAIEPTGRHRDALRWYREDLEDAYRDYDRCRYGA